MRKSLKAIAADIIDDAVAHDTFLTTGQMQAAYDLNEAQASSVKRYAKGEASARGLLWGFDPLAGSFRLCPEDHPEVAQAMLDYAYRAWAVNGSSNVYLVNGAYAQHYLHATDARKASSRTNKIADQILVLTSEVVASMLESH